MTTISMTTFTFKVMHRTDEPFTEGLMEAMARSMDGHAVGWETGEETVEVPNDRVEAELVELGNDGTFFDDDLDMMCAHCGDAVTYEFPVWVGSDGEITCPESNRAHGPAVPDTANEDDAVRDTLGDDTNEEARDAGA